jgi:hypothetical protein
MRAFDKAAVGPGALSAFAASKVISSGEALLRRRKILTAIL